MEADEELVLAYMARLKDEDPKMAKVGALHYLERDWWRGQMSRAFWWLKSERGRKPEQTPPNVGVTNLRYISKEKWIKAARKNGFRRGSIPDHKPRKLDLGGGEVYLTKKPNNALWLAYVYQSYGISQSTYYDELESLRSKIYYLVN